MLVTDGCTEQRDLTFGEQPDRICIVPEPDEAGRKICYVVARLQLAIRCQNEPPPRQARAHALSDTSGNGPPDARVLARHTGEQCVRAGSLGSGQTKVREPSGESLAGH